MNLILAFLIIVFGVPLFELICKGLMSAISKDDQKPQGPAC